MNRRNFLKSALGAAIGAGVLSRIPLVDAGPVFPALASDADDLAFVNYIAKTRLWPKYQAQWIGVTRAKANVVSFLREQNPSAIVRFEALGRSNEAEWINARTTELFKGYL